MGVSSRAVMIAGTRSYSPRHVLRRVTYGVACAKMHGCGNTDCTADVAMGGPLCQWDAVPPAWMTSHIHDSPIAISEESTENILHMYAILIGE